MTPWVRWGRGVEGVGVTPGCGGGGGVGDPLGVVGGATLRVGGGGGGGPSGCGGGGSPSEWVPWTPPRGPRAEAWCLLIHADASLSFSLFFPLFLSFALSWTPA